MEERIYCDNDGHFAARQIQELEKISAAVPTRGAGVGVSTDGGEFFAMMNSDP